MRHVTGIKAQEESVQRRTKRLRDSARFYADQAIKALENHDLEGFLEATDRARETAETLREHLQGRRIA